jgi:hypothetical protein
MLAVSCLKELWLERETDPVADPDIAPTPAEVDVEAFAPALSVVPTAFVVLFAAAPTLVVRLAALAGRAASNATTAPTAR